VNNFTINQSIKKNLILASLLQDEMKVNFRKHNIYDINDDLTTILAYCDMESAVNLPVIKNRIKIINKSLNEYLLQLTESGVVINSSLKNLISVLNKNFSTKIELVSNIPNNLVVDCNYKVLERVIVFFIIEIISCSKNVENLKIQLDIENNELLLKIFNDDFIFSSNTLKEIDSIKEVFKHKLLISPLSSGIRVTICLPIHTEDKNLFESHDLL